jgi:protein ImuB
VRLLNWPIDRLARQRARARQLDAHCRLPIADCRMTGSGSAIPFGNWQSAIGNPLVLVRTVATRQLIVATNEAARALGIRPTMTLGEARALCATVAHEEHDPSRDWKSLEALARWMMRFSPVVALGPEGEDHGIFLDLTGCERTFHGLENVTRRIARALSKMRITARLALAPTPGAAWAMTFDPGHFVREDASGGTDLLRALRDLPLVALRLDPETVQALHHLGLETIGQILDLPRDQLPARFGPLLSLRLDQALGRISEPLVALEPPVVIKARMDFDGLVESLEAIWVVFKKLTGQVIRQLLRHGRGAREVQVEFYRAYATTLRTTIRLSRPSRDASNLFNLLRCAMETVETDEGFLGIALNVTSSERVADDQINLLGGDEFAAQIELDHLIERLRVRLGEDVVAQPELVESYVPERAYAWHGLPARGSPVQTRAGSPCHDLRPLHLLRRPVEIRAMVSPSHDRDGRPILFTLRGEVHRLAHVVGPERIAGQWWQGHFKTRDYFDVEDDGGKRFWIFRVAETGRWFLHGEFE